MRLATSAYSIAPTPRLSPSNLRINLIAKTPFVRACLIRSGRAARCRIRGCFGSGQLQRSAGKGDHARLAAVIGLSQVGRAAVGVEAAGLGISVEPQRLDLAHAGREQP